MTSQQSVLLHRSNIADGLRALLLAQHRYSRQIDHDVYTEGYCAGFDDALMAVAELVGVAPELHHEQQAIPARR